jgi:hypothetical protein
MRSGRMGPREYDNRGSDWRLVTCLVTRDWYSATCARFLVFVIEAMSTADGTWVYQQQRLRGAGFAIALSIIAAVWYPDRPGVRARCLPELPTSRGLSTAPYG